MKKAETLRLINKTVQVEGHRIPSPDGFEFLSLFVHRSVGLLAFFTSAVIAKARERNPDGLKVLDRMWNVSDLHTGERVTSTYETQESAVADVPCILKMKGADTMRTHINEIINEYGDLLT